MRKLSASIWAFVAASPALLGANEPSPCVADVSVLTTGAPLHGANGLRFDRAGRLHVASVLGREIVVMDPESGQISTRYTTADGVETPDDLAFGPDGSLYWTSIGTGEVGRITRAGRFESVAHLPPGANPIAFSADGRLFVGSCILGAGLFELDPSGVAPPRSIREFPGERCGVNGFDVGPDGRLYAPRFFASEVVSIDPDTGDMRTVASGFAVPAAAKFAPDGALFVVDTAAGELSRVDISTGQKQFVAAIPTDTDNLAFDAAGRIFISGFDDGSIHEVLGDGSLRVVSAGGLVLPGGVARTGTHLYVADQYSLVDIDVRTGQSRVVQKSIIGASELTDMMTVSAAGSNLVFSSWLASSVQVFDPDLGTVLESHLDFSIPVNAIAFDGGLAVAELGSGRVAFEKDGTRTSLLGGLLAPTGLVADGDTLYVSDVLAGTITRVTANGSSVVAADLVGPEGLAQAGDGRLLVVEAGAGRVSEVDPSSGEHQVLAEGLALGLPTVSGYPPSYAFNGISVGPSGRVYVTGDAGNVVYVLTTHHHHH